MKEGGRGMMGANVYELLAAGFKFMKYLSLDLTMVTHFFFLIMTDVPGAVPSRLSSFNRVESQRRNEAFTPISLVYCGKSVSSFNRRFSGELERDRSTVCLSGGET